MRTFPDRLRHALCFEILGLLIVTPLGVLVFDMPLEHLGVVTVGSATLAMLWTYVYNWGFDQAMQRLTGGTQKTVPLRVLHAVLFELGLLLVLLPFIAWWLEISLWQALVMDMAFAAFYMVYAFVFNWGYDRVFPLPEWQAERS
ncbi:PACE efflux transporter [Gemmobacter fulvus]|uniref:PACE efflux transporter n=1 Tax=Gemmobacter fulvus TaxID=2840474 RepID=A0A975S2Y6_9RHOB|nr:PACE efflux transporter [Gemmobacter fulvus]MBT9244784.1 PACE efflux transporter [Gemmobacter fulvus]QWK91625.1 PACE efflux transporter [Gemmobacter fulvus]